jgi:hypothetical protein
MTNYYQMFETLIKNNKLYNTTMTIEDFNKLIKIYFGFGGRNNTIKRWVKNFEDVDFITIKKKDNEWIVRINIGGSNDEDE